jgi:hypothetical protein
MKRISLILLFVLFTISLNSNIITEIERETVELALTIERVEQALLDYDIKHPEIVIKQVKLETGHLKHVKHYNLFGFMTKNGLMKFPSLDSVMSYKKNWQQRNYHGGNYYSFLKRIGYARDSTYIRTLKKM